MGEDIAVDGQGNAYITGWTGSTAATFPETVGVFQPQHAGDRDAFVAKVNPSPSRSSTQPSSAGCAPTRGGG